MNRKARPGHVQARRRREAWGKRGVALLPFLGVLGLLGVLGGECQGQETRLIETLRSGASWAEKDKACRELQVIGTRRSIPALAAMLSDEKLSHIARCALEPMPYPEAARALREALRKTSGQTLVGVISSLGFRRDEKAVPQLTRLLRATDAEIAGAAAAALGRTGTIEAASALRRFRASAAGKTSLRPVAAEASLTAAEQLLSHGKQEDAARIYEDLLRPRWPSHARLGAFVGLLKARPGEAVSRVVKAVAGKDPVLRAVAIANITELTAQGAAERFAAELPKLPGSVQAMLIGALADCGPRAASVVPAIVPLLHGRASSKSPEVRTAAAKALGKIGDAASVEVLCKVVAEAGSDADRHADRYAERRAAAKSLRLLRGDGVDAALVRCMKAAPPSARPELIDALVARGATGAVPDLFELASGGDKGTRASAFKALGWLAGAKDLPRLLRLLVELEGDAGRKDAELAAVRVSRKIATQVGKATRSRAALAVSRRAAGSPAKCSLLRVLGGIGDAGALRAVQAALKDRDAGVRDAAVRALADWPEAREDAPTINALIVEALLDVFRTAAALRRAQDGGTELVEGAAGERHRVLALRGCVRLLGSGHVPPEDTLSAYRELLKLGRRSDERKLVLAGLAKVAAPAARAVVEPLLSDATVRAEAEAALLGIAHGIMGSSPNEAKSIAKKLSAESKNDRLRKEALAIIRQVDKFEDYVMAWQVAGPYGEGKNLGELFKTSFPPEKVSTKGRAKGSAKGTAWRMLPIATKGDRPWMLNLSEALGGEHRAAYVRTWVHAGSGQSAQLDFGIDDGSKVWLGGKLVHADGAGGAAVPGEHKVNVRLRRGWNALLLKITQDTGPWQFCLRIRKADGGKLDGLRTDATREAVSVGPVATPTPAKDAPPVRAVPKGDWKPLFNGRDLSGWTKTGSAIARVEDGCLVGTQTTGKGGDLWAESQWDDFELRATYRVVWPANSGIWFRHDGRRGYQYDILKYKNPVAFSGTLYCPGKMFITRNPNESLENRDGWNEARIRAAADEITLWLNGTEVGKCRDKTLSKGRIGIQVHGGDGFKGMKIIFKRIEVRALTVQGGRRE